MALDINSLTPVPTEMPRQQRKHHTGANPFLDNGWLQHTYDTGEGAEVTVPGTFEEVPVLDKETKEPTGETRTVLRGDAHEVVFLIRQASNMLNIGARIITEPAKTQNRVKMVRVMFVGQDRKKRKSKDETEASE